MTKTAIAAPYPHDDSTEERLMKAMIRSDTYVANEISLQRRRTAEGFEETQAMICQSNLEAIKREEQFYKQVRSDLDQVSLDLNKLKRVLQLWNEEEAKDQDN